MKNNIKALINNKINFNDNQHIFNVNVNIEKKSSTYDIQQEYLKVYNLINHKKRIALTSDKKIINYNVTKGQDIFITFAYEYNQLIDIFYMENTLLYYNDTTTPILYTFDTIKEKIYDIFNLSKLDNDKIFEQIYSMFNNLTSKIKIPIPDVNSLREYRKIYIHRYLALFHFLNVSFSLDILNKLEN